MTFLSNDAVERLRDVATRPELPGDRYLIRRPLGRGGMGSVYAAHDRDLDREVAIKVSNAIAPAADLDQRLGEEARVLARLEHPGIVPVHDAGRLADGRWFYVMKLVRGETLTQHATTLTHEAARLGLIERLAETLAFAHAAGVVHRDLKPSNVMVGAFGEVLVLDWGAARVIAEAEPGGTRIGTSGFMAPEQAAGDPAAGPLVDVYGLGAIARWMWTGAAPPASKRLTAIIHKCLAERPADRYRGAAALLDDLTRYRRGDAISAYRETALERGARMLGRYRTFIWLVLAYLLMRVAFAFFSR